MMTTEYMEVTKPFRYLWLKSVKGVDLTNHCAKSLIGEYDSRVNARLSSLQDVPLSEEIYYLCGVAIPYAWKNNFHLAFRHKEGATLEYTSNGISVKIENAERIEFSDGDIDRTLPEAGKKAFSTCRNWQFANWYKKNIQ